jgi:hypothetical protein
LPKPALIVRVTELEQLQEVNATLSGQVTDLTAQVRTLLDKPVDPEVTELKQRLQAVFDANAALSGKVADLTDKMQLMQAKLDSITGAPPSFGFNSFVPRVVFTNHDRHPSHLEHHRCRQVARVQPWRRIRDNRYCFGLFLFLSESNLCNRYNTTTHGRMADRKDRAQHPTQASQEGSGGRRQSPRIQEKTANASTSKDATTGKKPQVDSQSSKPEAAKPKETTSKAKPPKNQNDKGAKSSSDTCKTTARKAKPAEPEKSGSVKPTQESVFATSTQPEAEQVATRDKTTTTPPLHPWNR